MNPVNIRPPLEPRQRPPFEMIIFLVAGLVGIAIGTIFYIATGGRALSSQVAAKLGVPVGAQTATTEEQVQLQDALEPTPVSVDQPPLPVADSVTDSDSAESAPTPAHTPPPPKNGILLKDKGSIRIDSVFSTTEE